MNNFDPTSPITSDVIIAEGEISVEDIAETQMLDATNGETTTNGKEATAAKVESVLASPTFIPAGRRKTDSALAAPSAALPTAPPAVPIAPAVILPPAVLKRTVSGRYRGRTGSFELELRVDVDGKRPMKRVSGDFYRIAGATKTYHGSFVVNSPTITVTTTQVTITGTGSYSFATLFPKIRLTIPRVPLTVPNAPATITFLTPTNIPGSTYICAYQSVYFRQVQYEQDHAVGVTPFTTYNTGSLPSGGPARTLSVVAAFAEAGIQMQTSGVWNAVPIAGAGPNARWSDAELHAAMQVQFSLWKDVPQWKVWLFAATLHELGPSLRGIMFDQMGKQRQGCAVFHSAIGNTPPLPADVVRAQLRTYVHELGHCFNLLHSWQKSLAVPPAPNRIDALSWMNYPQNYPGGASAYWAAFPFQFDDLEVVHLRHAFRNKVIMGGNNFAIGAASLEEAGLSDPVEDNSGLRLELEARKSFALGEPVVTEIKLYTTDLRGKQVHSHIHPNCGFVQIAIQKPNGQVCVYEPLIEHCAEDSMITLDAERSSTYESAYIGYGKDGFYFDQIGTYRLRAIYHALDGSEVMSNVLTLRVRSPLDAADEEVAELLSGDEQGTLLYLLGSDSDFLRSGNDAMELIIDKHGKHPLAVYARLVKGINCGREFKRIPADKQGSVRKPQTNDSVKMLNAVVEASETGMALDNITLNMAMRRLARVQKDAGKEKEAKDTMKRMVDIFTKKRNIKRQHVIDSIRASAEEI